MGIKHPRSGRHGRVGWYQASQPVVVATGMALAKLRRRQSQRGRVDPSARVSGAWEFVVDRLPELGVGVGAALTSAEVVDRVLATLGPGCAGPLRELSVTVDATRFDQRFPPPLAAAEDAWRQVHAFDQERRCSLSRLRRMRPAAFLGVRRYAGAASVA